MQNLDHHRFTCKFTVQFVVMSPSYIYQNTFSLPQYVIVESNKNIKTMKTKVTLKHGIHLDDMIFTMIILPVGGPKSSLLIIIAIAE